MIGFTFGSLFKEFESVINATSDVRYFQRQVILVPAGDGFCIRNEMTGRSQSSSFLKSQQPMPPVDAFATPTATIEIIGVQNELQIIIRRSLIRNFVCSTRPTRRCCQTANAIEDNNWNYNYALFIFDNLQNTDNVPSEAFVKRTFHSFDDQPIQ
uniref:TAP-C domain-containing protein n=1 Tax=Glossina palpalis gambiensis TaxID=67801 RepID=A0A1B0B6F4_9MUSC